MNILLTGAYGFLGKIIVKELEKNYNVTKLGLNPKNDIIFNLTNDKIKLNGNYDIVVHAAGKAHSIINSKKEKKLIKKINYYGTKNLLNNLKNKKIKSFIFISTVSVYGIEQGNLINEKYSLNGTSSYASSKILAEREVMKWGTEEGVNCTILRLPLVFGSNPSGNLKLMIDGIRTGMYFRLGRAENKRSVVLGEDIATFIPTLINKSGIYNLTDGYNPSVKEIENCISKKMNKKVKKIPQILINLFSRILLLIPLDFVLKIKFKKLTSNLTFDDKKAVKHLNWKPRKVIRHFNF